MALVAKRLQGDEFHAVMNYAYTDAIMGYFVKQELSLEKMLSEMNNQLMLYRQQTNQMQFNVLEFPRYTTLIA